MKLFLQQMVIEMLYELTKGRAYITTGVGQHQDVGRATKWYKYKYPRQFITSGGEALARWVTAIRPRWA